MEGSIVDTRDGRRRPFRWQQGTVVFGSGVEADLVLPDPLVAPKHGRFEVSEQGCRVVVEEGLKPVKVNGISTHESDVEVGDVVKIGPFQLSLAGTAAAAAPPEAAPEEEAPPPPPPARRPIAPSRHAAPSARAAASHHAPHHGSHHASHHAPYADDPQLEEPRAASRYRAVTAGRQADARSWLVGGAILAGIALIAVGFIVFSGNPWAGLADESMMNERAAVNEYIKNCDFETALARIRDGMAQTSDSSVKNKWIDLRDKLERHRAEYNEGKRELERIRNTVGKRQSYYIVNDDLPVYINRYGMYAPLAKEAEQLREDVRHGKMTTTVPAGSSEADLAPGQAAPAFEKRSDHAQGKEGAPKDAPIKDAGKDGHQ